MGLSSGSYVYYVTASDVNGAVSATSSPATITVTGHASLPPIANPIPVLLNSATPESVTSSVATGAAVPAFTQFLYFGLRGAQVENLQSFLVKDGYLPSDDATGFFGNITLSAVEKFQCAQDIVCTGGGGWGTIGPKTRTALNNLVGTAFSGIVPDLSLGTISASSSISITSTSSLASELQLLETELAALEKQAQ